MHLIPAYICNYILSTNANQLSVILQKDDSTDLFLNMGWYKT